ncbi:putative uracil-DNA glycosylase [Lupinus albus]|uniref:Putative uracil-DNA glycosylase n=1 Tax=Lupinus albus TaxID=3870 RepID=A0A6A4R2G4_LUPAL|nr:putative uracil-DNA glycosylase [Lupinus albus]
MVQSLLYLLSLMVEETWLEALNGELQKPYALTLSKFVQTEIFNALNSTPFSTLKVVILGQGVLLLNAVLTVRKHQANSHAKKGWEQFTDTVIKTISQKKEGVVFLPGRNQGTVVV